MCHVFYIKTSRSEMKMKFSLLSLNRFFIKTSRSEMKIKFSLLLLNRLYLLFRGYKS